MFRFGFGRWGSGSEQVWSCLAVVDALLYQMNTMGVAGVLAV